MIESFAHVSIKVKDIENSRKFYRDILKFTHLRDDESEKLKFSYFDMAGVELEILQSKIEDYKEKFTGTIDHMAFFVKDLDKLIEEFKNKNVKFIDKEPRKALQYKIMFIEGPDGERIEFMEK